MTDIHIHSEKMTMVTTVCIDLTKVKTVADLKKLVEKTCNFPSDRQLVYSGLKQYIDRDFVADMCTDLTPNINIVITMNSKITPTSGGWVELC
jgi:hypothetical protein